MTPQQQVDPYTYVGRGYALLLKVLAESTRSAAHRRVDAASTFDPNVWLWLASVQFNTAELLERGEDPWAPA